MNRLDGCAVTSLALAVMLGSLSEVAVTVVRSISPSAASPGAVTVTLTDAEAPGPSVILAGSTLTDQPLLELAARLIVSATDALLVNVCT